jgi:hypothetical protein
MATVMVAGLMAIASAGPYFQIQFGPSWPRDIRENAPAGRRVALEAAGKAGILVGDIAALGCAVDVLWNKSVEDSSWQATEVRGVDTVTVPRTAENKVERWVMFPVSFFVTIDPVPGLVVRPALTGQFGFNMMVYSNKEYENDEWVKTSDTGFYPGLYGKVSLDAIANLGTEAVGAMLGLSYQFTQPRRRVEGTENVYTHKTMHGLGLHAGLRFAIL